MDVVVVAVAQQLNSKHFAPIYYVTQIYQYSLAVAVDVIIQKMSTPAKERLKNKISSNRNVEASVI